MEGNIKPIDRTSVHKICSGQVVLTLATAVKELVENSIDAGATIVDVILEEHGSKLVEVSDNGKGVKSTDFQSLTLKHHTSKIADFSDLPFVSTFGFRGEALSSLCAVSDLEVTTRHVESDVGTNLKFDHNGNLIKSNPTARQVGTTVVLRNIFSTYPVRHKEFLRHIRREFMKMIQLLTAYCLISINKRITCTHITDKGRKSTVLATHNCKDLKDNIVSLFGEKQVKQLLKIQQKEPSGEILKEYFLPESAAETSKIFKLEGYISSSTHGEGRSSSDRQFFFISGRPCDLPKVSKLINEIYHTFNKHQYPFVLLNITLVEGSADVNVTPDKRQIFVPEEKVLLALVKASLSGMYDIQPSQIMMTPLNFVPIKKNSEDINHISTTSTPKLIIVNNHKEHTEPILKRKFEVPTLDDEDEDPLPPLFKSQKLDIHLNECESKIQSNLTVINNEDKSDVSKLEIDCSSTQNSCPKKSVEVKGTSSCLETPSNKFSNNSVNFTLTLPFNEDKIFKKLSPKKHGSDKLKAILNAARKSPSETQTSDFDLQKIRKKYNKNEMNVKKIESFGKEYIFTKISKPIIDLGENFTETVEEISTNVKECENEIILSYDEPKLRKKKYKTLIFSMDMFSQIQIMEGDKVDSETCNFRKFRSKILPTDNQKAEEELKKEISKDNFSKMDIIGQFNLGFIITCLNDDLFIIDQHATDEKYNFEMLQKETVLETQQLFQPQLLNLSSVSEAILLENLNVFEMNGFKFKINEENPAGEKIHLVSVPVSQNWQFGKEDVDELIFMLTDNPIRMIRPSRVNQMFASRACRKSVMIGTALTSPMMKKLIIHMGEIDQPWNCPHGRPTMRHLFNLNLLNPS